MASACGAALAACLTVVGAGEPVAAADDVRVVTLIDDMPGAGPLAVSPNGQTVYCLDEVRRAVVAFDAFAPERRRDVVAAAADGQPIPVAIGCLPGDLLAIVGRSGDEWSLRTFRIRPGEAAEPATPLQSIGLGVAATAAPAVRLVVSHTRDWLAVVGLPEPLPAVLRIVFAGAGLRPLAPDGWPRIATDTQPVAAAVSPADELVLLERPRDGVTVPTVAFYVGTGGELLRLETGLSQIRDAAFDRGAGALWVLAGDPASPARPEGLWRLDAVMRDGRQTVNPMLVTRLVAPRSMVAVSERSIVVTLAGSIVRIDPVAEQTRARNDEEQDNP
ncbi:MAG: hypothetical protein K8S94_10905 [Planctomycetia bacterium]|nr:hypothetical protein [Planctomycetia bacterium]